MSSSQVLLLGLVLAAGTMAAAQQTTVEFSNSFETYALGNFNTSTAVDRAIITSCSGGTAKVVSNATAARTGSRVAVLTVGAVCANWRLKMQTRTYTLVTSKSYTVCMWVKSSYTATPFLPKVALSMYFGNGTMIDAVQPRITNEWGQYCYSVLKVPAAGTYFWNLNVGAAAAKTTYWIDDVTLTSEPNAPFDNWMATAPARIEQLRKGDFSLDVRYSDGSPVPAAAVQSLSVTLKKHDFPFGLAYSPENFAQSQAAQLAWYKSKAAALFNGLVPENAFKWPYFEPTAGNRAAGLALLNQFYNFTATNDYQFMRQHTVEWFVPGDTDFTNHWSRTSGCAQYAANLKQRVEREVAAFPGVVKSLDVFNELLTRRAYADTCNLFSGGPNSVIVNAFKWAKAVRPDIKLCLNDFDTIAGDRFINFVEMVKWLQANGAPIGCIGAQSHLGPAELVPDKMAFTIEKMANLTGLPVEVTEVSFHTHEDQTTWQQTMTNETAQADAFEKMLTVYFSHPKVTALLLWGIVDGNHYIPSGGIFRSDGTPKPAGVVVERLITSTWNSSSPAVAVAPSTLGLPTFRGFFGRYEVKAILTAPPGATPITVTVPRVEFASGAGAAQTALLTLPVAPAGGGRKLLAGHGRGWSIGRWRLHWW